LFSAFALAYALFEVPSGWLGDFMGAAGGTGAHRAVVVVVHGADRRGLESRLAARDPTCCSARAKRGISQPQRKRFQLLVYR